MSYSPEELCLAESVPEDGLEEMAHEKTIGSKGKGLWGMKGAQLPAYIQHVYNDLVEGGKPTGSFTYRLAVGIVQNWARGSTGKTGGKVKPDTQAKAAAAIAEWEALRAKAHADNGKKKLKEGELVGRIAEDWLGESRTAGFMDALHGARSARALSARERKQRVDAAHSRRKGGGKLGSLEHKIGDALTDKKAMQAHAAQVEKDGGEPGEGDAIQFQPRERGALPANAKVVKVHVDPRTGEKSYDVKRSDGSGTETVFADQVKRKIKAGA